MRIKAGVLCAVLFSSTPGRADDSPAPPEAKAAPSWTTKGLFGDIAVSRDGKWVAGCTLDGFRLFPTDGGAPVPLDVGKKDHGTGFKCEFSGDSKWVVVPGDSPGAVVKGVSEGTTQSVYVWQTDAPTKRKVIKLQLKAESLSKDVKKLMDPKLRTMKTLSGEVSGLVCLPGPRVLFDRGELGVEVWDLAASSKYAAAPGLDSEWSCGISADGLRCVLTSSTGVEIRDLKANRAVTTIAVPEFGKRGVMGEHPVFGADGSSVVVAQCTRSRPEAGEEAAPDDYAVACWSVADGKKRWETPVGAAKYVDEMASCGGYAVLLLADKLHLLDLRDGKEAPHRNAAKKVTAARPTADGTGVWIVTDDVVLTRMDLPKPEEK